ncbi:MAG: Bug family tripartite tricarboxylate transporter substrate binding protein [Rhodospirillaceae bacterium]
MCTTHRTRGGRSLAWAIAAGSLLVSFTCFAQGAATGAFPSRPVRWIVPFPVGGSVDLVARVLGQKLYEEWREQLVVDNRPGAGGRLGTQLAVTATPDGYTQLLTLNTNLTVDRSLFKNLAYDPEKAFVPVTITASTSQLLVVNLSFPAKSVSELIAACKAKPGQINYGSSGVGGSLHLAMELFKSRAGIDVVHVAYKGGPPAATDLIAGQISMMFFNTPAALPFVRTGKLRALGVSTAKRSPLLPDVPAIAEAGLPGFDTEVWYGLVAPAGTASDVVDYTYRSVAKVLAASDVRKALQDLGAEPNGLPPKEFAKRMRGETQQWASIIRSAHIRFD